MGIARLEVEMEDDCIGRGIIDVVYTNAESKVNRLSHEERK